jgi:hypothetical protein
MRIQPSKDPQKAPRTRRELLSHLWAVGYADVNIWREGPMYVLHSGSVLTATHCRRITAMSFSQWEAYVKNAPRSRADYC